MDSVGENDIRSRNFKRLFVVAVVLSVIRRRLLVDVEFCERIFRNVFVVHLVTDDAHLVWVPLAVGLHAEKYPDSFQ